MIDKPPLRNKPAFKPFLNRIALGSAGLVFVVLIESAFTYGGHVTIWLKQ